MKRIFAFATLAMVLIGALSLSAVGGAVASTAFNNPSLFVGVTGILFILSILTPSVSRSQQGALYVSFTQGICEKVQMSLNQLLGSKTPNVLRTPVGYLDALISPQNTGGIMIAPVNGQNGKVRKVLVKFLRRGTSDDIIHAIPGDCDMDIEKQPYEDTVDITNWIGTKWLGFTEDEMDKLCEPNSVFMEQTIRGEIDALCVGLNKKLLALQAANFGTFYGGSTIEAVSLLSGVKNSPLFYGESQIMELFTDLGLQGRPILVGAGNLAHYVRQTGIGCCNDAGINLGQAGAFDFFRDRYVNTEIGSNHAIGLVPGYVQLLTWNKYTGTRQKESISFSHSTITDPVTGLTFDMKWKYDDCAEKYVVRLSLYYELFFLPSTAFEDADELTGFNGSVHFRIDNDESCYC